ncbi:MAG: tRNA (adenosine(37)-N6)-threonylcarbamoyltransferase complex ATPase subunit type 1 TsaE [Candidatus Paceibacterota bacterium]
MNKKYLTISPIQTKEIARKLAKSFFSRHPKKQGFIIGLKGDLGGGKTTFLQGFAKGLGIKEKITSPTFVIAKRFSLFPLKKNRAGFKNFYHFDCYRIRKPREILSLDFVKIISDPRNVIAIEWPERIKKALPGSISLIEFKFIDKKTREIVIKLKDDR